MQNENPYAAYSAQTQSAPVNQVPQQPAPHKDHKILIIVLALLATLFLVFALVQTLALSSERSNREELVGQAVEEAKPDIRTELQAEFDEQAKLPLDVYKASSQYGSLKLSYPKNWSAYVDQKSSGSTPFSFTAHPSVVPSEAESYALRVEVVNDSYAEQLSDYQKDIEKGEVKSSSFSNSGEKGVLLTGSIDKFNGRMVLLPLRDKTIKIWTESNNFAKDFQKTLDNLTFEP